MLFVIYFFTGNKTWEIYRKLREFHQKYTAKILNLKNSYKKILDFGLH